jgi:hypothetical protein
MRGRREERIEAVIDHGAAALFAAGLGFTSFLLLRKYLPQPGRSTVAVALAALGYWIVARVLRRIVAKTPKFDVPQFELPVIDVEGVGELVLTDADRLKHTIAQLTDELLLTDADRLRPQSDELVLDDILAELGPDSRVVRLFDPVAMPTPGQLSARIEQHLRGTAPPAAPADASQALYEALSDLRRSLR